MSNITIKGNASVTIAFDFEKRFVRFIREGSLNKQLGLVDVDFPFDDVTGFVLKKGSMLTASEVFVVIKDTLPSTDTGSNFSDSYLSRICLSSSSYKMFEQAIQRFCKEVKTVPIHSKDEIKVFSKWGKVDYPKVKYKKDDNPYETEFKEYRIKCNVCGHIFCYNKDDIRRNEELKKKAKSVRREGVTQTWFTSQITGNQSLSRAQQLESQIMDYSKCPNCGSIDLTELSEEEFKAAQAPAAQAAPATSPMDELKKLKELLDMGIVTQEEFDTKKKQLLGL